MVCRVRNGDAHPCITSADGDGPLQQDQSDGLMNESDGLLSAGPCSMTEFMRSLAGHTRYRVGNRAQSRTASLRLSGSQLQLFGKATVAVQTGCCMMMVLLLAGGAEFRVRGGGETVLLPSRLWGLRRRVQATE